MKVAIYTTILGNVNKLIDPKFSQRYPLYCFTDGKLTYSKDWNIINVNDINIPLEVPGDRISLTRYFKLLPHIHFPDYDYTIWVDAAHWMIGDLSRYIPFEEDMLLFKHANTNCMYKELDDAIKYKRDNVDNIKRIYKHYEDLGVPKGLEVAGCSIIWRKNTKSCNDFNEFWWKEFVSVGSKRDQPIWAYCNWVKPVNKKFISGNQASNAVVTRRNPTSNHWLNY